MDLQIEELMEELVQQGGSDLHLAAGQPPYGRFSGALRPMRDQKLTEDACNRLIFSMINNAQRKQLEQTWELDCAYGLRGVARFRVNVYRQRNTYAACLRALGNTIPSLMSLDLPAVVEETSHRPRGLILVTGPTGSGKTTTLAALLNHINLTRAEHILTIEDPIEFTYKNEKSVIHQRQLGEDTRSFAAALRAALREDPDVILVGEMRDLETIQLAISAAETGHLVFGTLHTSSASQTVDRMVDVFPPAQQTQIRVQLSSSLLAVFSQTLCRRLNPAPGQFGRVMAQEIMLNTPAIGNLIREGKTAQIYSQIQTGGQLGMQTLERALANLVQQGSINREEALAKASKPEELARLIDGAAAEPQPPSRQPVPTFTASYTTASGQTRRLQVQAADLSSARRSLRQRGIVPTSLELAGAGEGKGKGSSGGAPANLLNADLGKLLEARPGVREKALFANKMAALVDAGVPIVRSLSLMAEQQKMPLFKRALTAVNADVNEGESLGTAMRRWPKVFDKLTIAMVEAGEAGGVLDETLRRLSMVLESNAKLQNQIKGALGYPVSVLVIAVLVFLGMTIFVIPTFAGIFASLNAKLPPFTQLMVDLSSLLRSPFALVLVGILVAALLLFLRFYATPVGRRRVDALVLKLPLFGDLIKKTATAQFCRTFSSLSRAGVPILLALEIVQETTGNTILGDAIQHARGDVQEGVQLSVALARDQVFPDLAMSMLAIGEETGQLDTMLSKVADFYEDEVEATVKVLTSMLEPMMIVFVGGIVGSILVAMYLPMFSIFEQIK